MSPSLHDENGFRSGLYCMTEGGGVHAMIGEPKAALLSGRPEPGSAGYLGPSLLCFAFWLPGPCGARTGQNPNRRERNRCAGDVRDVRCSGRTSTRTWDTPPGEPTKACWMGCGESGSPNSMQSRILHSSSQMACTRPGSKMKIR